MLSIFRETRPATRFRRLVASLCKAGDLADWTDHATLSGVPPGRVVGPMVSHISRDRLAQFVETVGLPAPHRGDCRRLSRPSRAGRNAARRQKMAGADAEARTRRQQAQPMPSRAPSEPPVRRLGSCRSADDGRLGCSGPRNDAEQIPGQRTAFRREPRTRALSPDKTLSTHARTDAARCLGSDVVSPHATDPPCRRGKRRGSTGAPGVQVPVEGIRATGPKSMQHGNPMQRAERLREADCTMVAQDQAAYRGVGQSYVCAVHVHRLWQVPRVMTCSRAHTRADNHRRSVRQVIRTSQPVVAPPYGPRQVLEGRQPRGAEKHPLGARCGGLALRRHPPAVIHDRPPQGENSLPSALVQRLLAEHRDLCGSAVPCEVQHLRTRAEVQRPGQQERPVWMQRLAMRRRTTLVVGQQCHAERHRERPSRRQQTAQITGQPTGDRKTHERLGGGLVEQCPHR